MRYRFGKIALYFGKEANLSEDELGNSEKVHFEVLKKVAFKKVGKI
jgi:hypothetical protein